MQLKLDSKIRLEVPQNSSCVIFAVFWQTDSRPSSSDREKDGRRFFNYTNCQDIGTFQKKLNDFFFKLAKPEKPWPGPPFQMFRFIESPQLEVFEGVSTTFPHWLDCSNDCTMAIVDVLLTDLLLPTNRRMLRVDASVFSLTDTHVVYQLYVLGNLSVKRAGLFFYLGVT